MNERRKKIEVLERQLELLRIEAEYEDAKVAYLTERDRVLRDATAQALDNGLEWREVRRASKLAGADFAVSDHPTVGAYERAKERLREARRQWRTSFRPHQERKPGDAIASPEPVTATVKAEG